MSRDPGGVKRSAVFIPRYITQTPLNTPGKPIRPKLAASYKPRQKPTAKHLACEPPREIGPLPLRVNRDQFPPSPYILRKYDEENFILTQQARRTSNFGASIISAEFFQEAKTTLPSDRSFSRGDTFISRINTSKQEKKQCYCFKQRGAKGGRVKIGEEEKNSCPEPAYLRTGQ